MHLILSFIIGLFTRMDTRFYVYVYLDPRKRGSFKYGEFEFDYEPFYVGKGNGYRSIGHIWEAHSIANNNIKQSDKPNLNWRKIRKILKIEKEFGTPIVKILQDNLNEDEAYSFEIKVVSCIGRADYKLGPLLNMTDAGEGGKNPAPEVREQMRQRRIGQKHSQEVKNKISKSHGNVSPKEKYVNRHGQEAYYKILKKKAKAQQKNILQYSIEGQFIKEWEGVSVAANFFKVPINNISCALRGKTKTIAGFMWRYKLSEDFPKQIEPVKLNKKHTEVLQYTLNGEFIKKWHSIKEASEAIGCPHPYIVFACQGKPIQSTGFIWKYADK